MRSTHGPVVALLVAALPASAAEYGLPSIQYGWSISASNVDPHVHTGGVPGGLGYLYLWYECNLLLAVAGCPNAPVIAGQIVALFPAAGPASVCIVPSPAGNRITVDCATTPTAWPIGAVGWDAVSPPSCDDRGSGDSLCGLGCHQSFCHPDLGCIEGFCIPCGSCLPCGPNCTPVSVSPTPWGNVKSLYR
jgi:hypothetical protein